MSNTYDPIFGTDSEEDDDQEFDTQQASTVITEQCPSISTKQSYAINETNEENDKSTYISRTVAPDVSSVEPRSKNEILRKLMDSESLSATEYTRLKCKLLSRLHPVKVESIITQCARKKMMKYKLQRRDTIAIAGMAKLYVGDLIEIARNIMGTDNTGSISPDALRQAAKRWRDDHPDMFPLPVC